MLKIYFFCKANKKKGYISTIFTTRSTALNPKGAGTSLPEWSSRKPPPQPGTSKACVNPLPAVRMRSGDLSGRGGVDGADRRRRRGRGRSRRRRGRGRRRRRREGEGGGEIEVEREGEGHGEEMAKDSRWHCCCWYARKPLWNVDHEVERFLSGGFNRTKIPILSTHIRQSISTPL